MQIKKRILSICVFTLCIMTSIMSGMEGYIELVGTFGMLTVV